jgi:hypothetical protein
MSDSAATQHQETVTDDTQQGTASPSEVTEGSSDTDNDAVTEQYHAAKAADDITEYNLDLDFMGTSDSGSTSQPNGLYFCVTNDPPIEHDWIAIEKESVLKQAVEAGVEFPPDFITKIEDSICTGETKYIGTHGGTIIVTSEELPIPLRFNTSNWKPSELREYETVQRAKRNGIDPSSNVGDTPTDRHWHMSAPPQVARNIGIANLLAQQDDGYVTGVVQEPEDSSSNKATYPVTINRGEGTFTLKFKFPLPSEDNSGIKTEPFENLVSYVGGSPQFIPDTEVAIAPTWLVPQNHWITTTAQGIRVSRGSPSGAWCLTTPELMEYLNSPLWKRWWARRTSDIFL